MNPSPFIKKMMNIESKWIRDNSTPAAIIIYKMDSQRDFQPVSTIKHDFGELHREDGEMLGEFINRSSADARTFLSGKSVSILTV